MTDDPLKQQMLRAIKKDMQSKKERDMLALRVNQAEDALKKAEADMAQYYNDNPMGRQTNFGLLMDSYFEKCLKEIEQGCHDEENL